MIMKTNETNKPNEKKEIQKVYSRRVALELRKQGFKIIKTEVNYKRPQFDVYCFEKTEKLEKALYGMSTR